MKLFPYEVQVTGIRGRQRHKLPVYLWEAEVDPWWVLRKARYTWPDYDRYEYRGIAATFEELDDWRAEHALV